MIKYRFTFRLPVHLLLGQKEANRSLINKNLRKTVVVEKRWHDNRFPIFIDQAMENI